MLSHARTGNIVLRQNAWTGAIDSSRHADQTNWSYKNKTSIGNVVIHIYYISSKLGDLVIYKASSNV